MKNHIWIIEFLTGKKWSLVADYPYKSKKEAKNNLKAWRIQSPDFDFRITKYKAK